MLRRPSPILTPLAMLRQRKRVALPVLLEPFPCEPMAEGAVLLGEHAVRRVAIQGVAQRVLGLAGEPRAALRLDDLGVDQLVQQRIECVATVRVDR